MVTTERVKFLSPSDPYLQSSIGFAYKEQQARHFSISRFLAPFEYRIWIVIFVILLLSILLIILSKKFSRKWRHFLIGGYLNRSPILNTWGLMVGKPISNQFIANGRNFGNFARTLTMFWMLLWFVIRSFYEGALYTDLQRNSLTSSYDTIEKVKASNCKIFAASATLSFLKNVINENR